MARSLKNEALQSAILGQLRARLAGLTIADEITNSKDEQLLFRVFHAGHGLRLTRLGQEFMKQCFKCHEFTTTEKPNYAQIMFLDQHAKLPYFFEGKQLALYDEEFANYVSLVNGNLASLVKIGLIP